MNYLFLIFSPDFIAIDHFWQKLWKKMLLLESKVNED